MLGLILLYFIGKSFYKLADECGKSNWGFAILGIAVYYAGTILAGILIGIVIVLSDPYADLDNPFLGLLGVPFGLLSWWGLHSFLKRKWSKNGKMNNDQDILDDNLLEDDVLFED